MMRIGLLAAGVLLSAFTAQALIIVDGQDNQTAPADDPGWEYVGSFTNGTGVYLGNQWAVTAKHLSISSSSVFTLNGQVYDITPGPVIYNDDDTPADLQLFQLHQDPNLPPLDIRQTQINYEDPVTLIATGRIAGEMFTAGSYSGYQWDTTRQKLWGNNIITAHAKVNTPIVYNGKKTYAFSTQFDSPPWANTDEAQAADKDSGGGAFIKNELGQWQLAGIIFGIEAGFPTQPRATLDFDDTFYVNLAHYRYDIMATMYLPGDANRDNIVNLTDLDILGNNFNQPVFAWEEGDFNGDREVSLIDLDLMGEYYGESVSFSMPPADHTTATASVPPTGIEIPEPSPLVITTLMLIAATQQKTRPR